MGKDDVLSKYLPYCLTALTLAVVVYVRIRLLAVPLERDEGEFAYMGQLLLKGIPPFSHAYTMKLPGVSIVYALAMFLFGQTPGGIHTGLLMVNGICIYLVYLLARRLFDRNTALFSCVSYSLLSLSSSVKGVSAHATHFVVLFALAGLLLLLRSIDKRQIIFLFISGLCFGMSVIMKQHAVVLLIFAVLYVLWRTWANPIFDNRTFIAGSFLFLSGTIIPYALTVLWMLKTGNFANFWFWTVQYAREYTSNQTLVSGLHDLNFYVSRIVESQLPLWILAGFGLISLIANKIYCTDRFLLFGFFLFSFFAICPGLFFREHYFVLLLPAVAAMIGAGLGSVRLFIDSYNSEKPMLVIQALLFIMAISYGLYQERYNLFLLQPLEVSRATYGLNPFPESIQIADYIKNNTKPDDKIAILGSEPEILFYADRLSATGHIYMYGLMENQPYAAGMQMQMIREIEAARPSYIIFVNVDVSWLEQESSVRAVFNWKDQYIRSLYDPVGVIDISPYLTKYIWDDAAVGYTPVSEYFVSVYKRKRGV